MPEAVEVGIQGEQLKKMTSNKLIIGLNWDKNSKFSRKKIPGLDLVKLPLLVKNVFTRGKIIVFECSDSTSEKIYITSHLGMSGYYTKTKDKHSNFWFSFGIEIEIETKKKGLYQETFVLYFDDLRHFGNFTICHDLSAIWKKNGPCILSTALLKYGQIKKQNLHKYQTIATREYWIQCLTKSRMKICDFLLDQKNIAGIGNYLRAEIMYLSKIHPERKTSSLSLTEKNTLYDNTLKTVYHSYISKVSNSSHTSSCGGHFRLCVYNQSEDPDGNPVTVYQSKGRNVHFSPAVQLLVN